MIFPDGLASESQPRTRGETLAKVKEKLDLAIVWQIHRGASSSAASRLRRARRHINRERKTMISVQTVVRHEPVI